MAHMSKMGWTLSIKVFISKKSVEVSIFLPKTGMIVQGYHRIQVFFGYWSLNNAGVEAPVEEHGKLDAAWRS